MILILLPAEQNPDTDGRRGKKKKDFPDFFIQASAWKEERKYFY